MTTDPKKIKDLFVRNVLTFAYDWDEYCSKYKIEKYSYNSFREQICDHWHKGKNTVLVVAPKNPTSNQHSYYLIPHKLAEKALVLGAFPSV